MASAAQIPVSEYLQTTFRPDREYVDGGAGAQRRQVGTFKNSMAGGRWFLQHEPAWNVIGSIEQLVQVSIWRVRVPDIVVLRPGPQPDVLTDRRRL